MVHVELTGQCELCGQYNVLETISKQIGGTLYLKYVCPRCKEAHERELELTRENFRRQFGEN